MTLKRLLFIFSTTYELYFPIHWVKNQLIRDYLHLSSSVSGPATQKWECPRALSVINSKIKSCKRSAFVSSSSPYLEMEKASPWPAGLCSSSLFALTHLISDFSHLLLWFTADISFLLCWKLHFLSHWYDVFGFV